MQTSVRIIDQLRFSAEHERAELVSGLRAAQASISPKYFYDPLGCALYGAICQLDEYYPTRVEREIFQQYRTDIAASVGRFDTLVDLGAGDCCKAEGWLPFLSPKRYVAVDIAQGALASALERMSSEFADIEMIGVATDFSSRLELPAEALSGRTVFFYPGSSIGNFARDEAVRLLRDIRQTSLGGLLIGVDAKKDPRTLDAAYADALGVTAAFNLNALRHINRLLGANFVEEHWKHCGFYNADAGRVEMHLESKRAQSVLIDGAPRTFAQGERIHTESSYKYSQSEFETLLHAAGYREVQCWSNSARAFWVFWAK